MKHFIMDRNYQRKNPYRKTGLAEAAYLSLTFCRPVCFSLSISHYSQRSVKQSALEVFCHFMTHM